MYASVCVCVCVCVRVGAGMDAGMEEGSKRSIMQKKLDDMTMMITQAGLVFGVGKSFMFVRHENQSPAHMYTGSKPSSLSHCPSSIVV